MDTETAVRSIVRVRLDRAKSQGEAVSSETLRSWVEGAATLLAPEESIDIDRLTREVEAAYNVHVGDWNALQDNTDHIIWLTDDFRQDNDWRFWERYQRFLEQEQGLSPPAVQALDAVTNDILGRLENPKRAGAWDRRGLVAGQVQSGKTGNYVGLIAKALDAGYKLVVVLAGVHNSLRSQTQARIDMGILGFDTRSYLVAEKAVQSSRIGVGKLAGRHPLVNSFTSSSEKGDFTLRVAQNLGVRLGGDDPIILVVKKNTAILKNLHQWAISLNNYRNANTGRPRIPSVPLLVIDDEADHASVNTNSTDRDEDPSKINGHIRRFLNTFDQVSYVAYTATPFANIFISPEEAHPEAGEDLFPRSFIVNLPAPSNYTGPEEVFGLQQDSVSGIDEVQPLPIVRTLDDYQAWLPDRHKSNDSVQSDLPESLKDAVVIFLMSGAVRRIRGQERSHHSMLVHVTRYKKLQLEVAEQVGQYLQEVRQRLQYGEGAEPSLAKRAERLYREDMVPTTENMLQSQGSETLVAELPRFEDLWAALLGVATDTRVHVVNGESADALQYVDHPDGLSVIAIGGDKLSRGLTLEGLTVSYYLRASRMYDTLMQMGRWFGYRPGYLDVCRLYTTGELVDWYERITSASAELQREFEVMAVVRKTPAEFGLRVRQHPDGLLVTSPSKLRNAQRIALSFSGTISETITFDPLKRQANFTSLERLIASMSTDGIRESGAKIWRHVDPLSITEFLSNYTADKSAVKAQPSRLLTYVNSRLLDDELVSWTVVLADKRDGVKIHLAGHEIGLTERANHMPDPASTRYTIKRLVSPNHELVDLKPGSERWDEALERTLTSWRDNPRRRQTSSPPDRPSGLWERQLRDPSDGILLLYALDSAKWRSEGSDPTPFVGFAASFPWSAKAVPQEYMVNEVLLRDQLGWDEDDTGD